MNRRISTQRREGPKAQRRKGANKAMQARISWMARIKDGEYSLREIREIRGKKSSRERMMPTYCSAK
jgi:hypothetical protein